VIETTVEVVGELISKPYIDITLASMARFRRRGPARRLAAFYRACWQRLSFARESFRSKGDASSASYFLALGAIRGGPLRVEGIGPDSVQGDVRFADALSAMGAQSHHRRPLDRGISAGRRNRQAARHRASIAITFPDAAMTLATTALFAEGPTTLRHIASWRVKETDRIAAMAAELRKLGVRSSKKATDYIRIDPPGVGQVLQAATIDTYDDHRMAMSCSLAALGTPLADQ
jgi:3-phosphoshikimate 1-carboxyvinyltransferase